MSAERGLSTTTQSSLSIIFPQLSQLENCPKVFCPLTSTLTSPASLRAQLHVARGFIPHCCSFFKSPILHTQPTSDQRIPNSMQAHCIPTLLIADLLPHLPPDGDNYFPNDYKPVQVWPNSELLSCSICWTTSPKRSESLLSLSFLRYSLLALKYSMEFSHILYLFLYHS